MGKYVREYNQMKSSKDIDTQTRQTDPAIPNYPVYVNKKLKGFFEDRRN